MRKHSPARIAIAGLTAVALSTAAIAVPNSPIFSAAAQEAPTSPVSVQGTKDVVNLNESDTFTAQIPGATEGTVQFYLDGIPQGGPVDVKEGKATSAPITSRSFTSGDFKHTVTARYTTTIEGTECNPSQDGTATFETPIDLPEDDIINGPDNDTYKGSRIGKTQQTFETASLDNPVEIEAGSKFWLKGTQQVTSGATNVYEVGFNPPIGSAYVEGSMTRIGYDSHVTTRGNDNGSITKIIDGRSFEHPYWGTTQTGRYAGTYPKVNKEYVGVQSKKTYWERNGNLFDIEAQFVAPTVPGVYVPQYATYKYQRAMHSLKRMDGAAFLVPAQTIPDPTKCPEPTTSTTTSASETKSSESSSETSTSSAATNTSSTTSSEPTKSTTTSTSETKASDTKSSESSSASETPKSDSSSATTMTSSSKADSEPTKSTTTSASETPQSTTTSASETTSSSASETKSSESSSETSASSAATNTSSTTSSEPTKSTTTSTSEAKASDTKSSESSSASETPKSDSSSATTTTSSSKADSEPTKSTTTSASETKTSDSASSATTSSKADSEPTSSSQSSTSESAPAESSTSKSAPAESTTSESAPSESSTTTSTTPGAAPTEPKVTGDVKIADGTGTITIEAPVKGTGTPKLQINDGKNTFVIPGTVNGTTVNFELTPEAIAALQQGKNAITFINGDGSRSELTANVDCGVNNRGQLIGGSIGLSLALLALAGSFAQIPGLQQANNALQQQLGFFNPALAQSANQIVNAVAGLAGTAGIVTSLLFIINGAKPGAIPALNKCSASTTKLSS